MAVTRRPQQSWIDAAARREAARAAFYDRPDEIVWQTSPASITS